ncbi:MAG: amidase [Alphaproteobacteria bacterium]|nr:amidase [Alphaproteobacteria bacterium]
MRDPFGAFCDFSTAHLEGAAGGPLAGLTFAAKDLFDIAGHVTGGGNPDWLARHRPAVRTATVVERLTEAGASMVGKTHTDELSKGIFGENAHYGTPTNPRAPGRVPGGSSSGSAVAVAGGLVDFALGTDTGGSVRVPASFCGIYGIRPTYGRLPFDGVITQAPSFDTVGWFARDPDLLARVGSVLLSYGKPKSRARLRRLIIAEDAFAVADATAAAALTPAISRLSSIFSQVERRRLSSASLADWLRHQTSLQGREAWATFGDWIDRNNPRFGFEVADNFLRGLTVDDTALASARAFQSARKAELSTLLDGETVVCLPTTPFPAPPAGQPRSVMWRLRVPVITLTCIAGVLGAPQLNLPLAKCDGLPLGCSVLAHPGGDELLLDVARRVVSG